MVGEMQAHTADIQCVWRLCYPCNRICLKSQKSANFCKYIISRSEQRDRRMSCKTILSTLMDMDGGVDYERYQKSEYLETGAGFEGN